MHQHAQALNTVKREKQKTVRWTGNAVPQSSFRSFVQTVIHTSTTDEQQGTFPSVLLLVTEAVSRGKRIIRRMIDSHFFFCYDKD
jgi:hypothetical protein